MPRKNRVGQRFGRLVVMSWHSLYNNNHSIWTCKCDCGNTVNVLNSALNNKKHRTLSCGCLKRELDKKMGGTKLWKNPENHGTHRETANHNPNGTPEYRAWKMIKRYCYTPTNKRYFCHGAVGIKLCEKWISFQGFLEDMGRKPQENFCLRRKDSEKDYCSDNCYWGELGNKTRLTKTEAYTRFNEFKA